MLDFFSVNTVCQKDVVGITRHFVTTISAFSFTMLLLDRILTHIVNHISNTSYHLQYLYCQGGYVFGAKPNLITCVGYIFLSAIQKFLSIPTFDNMTSRNHLSRDDGFRMLDSLNPLMRFSKLTCRRHQITEIDVPKLG